MPRFEFLWRHAIINTKCTWLHGDPRGFRSRKHRIHSTGDYKMPPPPGEHEGLHAYQVGKSGAEIHIARAEQAIIGCALRDYLDKQGYKALAVAVTKTHAHVLVVSARPNVPRRGQSKRRCQEASGRREENTNPF